MLFQTKILLLTILLVCKVLMHTFRRYKMNEAKSCTSLNCISLNVQTNFRLNEINKIKDYFNKRNKRNK